MTVPTVTLAPGYSYRPPTEDDIRGIIAVMTALDTSFLSELAEVVGCRAARVGIVERRAGGRSPGTGRSETDGSRSSRSSRTRRLEA
jgi:hypothetical protein